MYRSLVVRAACPQGGMPNWDWVTRVLGYLDGFDDFDDIAVKMTLSGRMNEVSSTFLHDIVALMALNEQISERDFDDRSEWTKEDSLAQRISCEYEFAGEFFGFRGTFAVNLEVIRLNPDSKGFEDESEKKLKELVKATLEDYQNWPGITLWLEGEMGLGLDKRMADDETWGGGEIV